MAKKGKASTRRAARPTRAERSEAIRKAVLEGATFVVSRRGYEQASIALITQRAKVAQGTFYNYFKTRQEIFDLLPPAYAREMLAYIASKMNPGLGGIDREIARFEVYFEFFAKNNYGTRIVNEAAVMAPKGYEQYFRIVTEGYRRALRRSMDKGEIPLFGATELNSLADLLISIRTGLSNQYFLKEAAPRRLPPDIVLTYRKFIEAALFERTGKRAASAQLL